MLGGEMPYWPRIAICFLLAAIALAQDEPLAAKSRAAKEALVTGRYSEAIKFYRELVAALPDNPGLRFNLGMALVKAGQPSQAIPELDRATRAQPNAAGAWFLLGLAHQQMGQVREAIAPLEKAVILDGANVDARFELADAELAGGDPLDAMRNFLRVTAERPGMARAWQGLGIAYVALGERAAAMLADRAADSSYARVTAARTRAVNGRYPEALSLYQEAIRELSACPGLHAERAAIYRAAGHPDWAAVEEERESRVPKPDCREHATACAYTAGDWEKTLIEARKSATAENFYWASTAYNKLAEQSFARLAALPPSAETHELQAESYQRMGRRVEAVAEWRKAVAAQPGNQRLQGRLARSLARNRNYEEAETLLEPLVAAQPENSEWRYWLGDVLLEQRRVEAALPHLEAAVRGRPDFLPAQEALGRAFLAVGQNEKAVSHLQKARAIDDGGISFALGSVYRRLGRTEESRAALARYQQLAQRNGPVGEPADEGAIPPP
jgi:superkiller protein 3